jgi:hypothetical protein
MVEMILCISSLASVLALLSWIGREFCKWILGTERRHGIGVLYNYHSYCPYWFLFCWCEGLCTEALLLGFGALDAG